MKYVKTTLVPALLLAVFCIAGCRGNGYHVSGMPARDTRGPQHLEYADPDDGTPPAPVPAPDPPSALLRPDPAGKAALPMLPGEKKPAELHDTFFDDEAGYSPVPQR